MLTNPCSQIQGVGPVMQKALARCNIHVLQDLLFYMPTRYQDRTNICPIRNLRFNEWAVILATVIELQIVKGKKPMLICCVQDASGICRVRFFHVNAIKNYIKLDTKLLLFGQIKLVGKKLEMMHPEYKVINSNNDLSNMQDSLTPIYPITYGLTQNKLRTYIKTAINLCRPYLEKLEWLDEKTKNNLNLYDFAKAIESIHFPDKNTQLNALETGLHPGLKRLAIDEFAAHYLCLFFAQEERKKFMAYAIDTNVQNKIKNWIKTLPYTLTQSQVNVLNDIESDLFKNIPMYRLVQGDVGSGKTIVAAIAALYAIYSGYQVAFMAPTDLLSEQILQNFNVWFTPLGIEVLRLSGTITASTKKQVLAKINDGSAKMIVGTHALFQKDVTFKNLGLIIIDEQHRFGVNQRLLLQNKGESLTQIPHQLLLSATPIPRTLAMTQFSHLNLSSINERPKGRIEIITSVLHENKRDTLIEKLKKIVTDNNQVYWVCSAIEKSETLDCEYVLNTFENLKSALPEIRIGIVHGKMSSVEKDTTMLEFKEKKLQILVATSVIEVGIDVPSANFIIIENAQRFGLSQLHQLRGRVGRGNMAAYCVLLYNYPISYESKQRLQYMREINDGFLLAEKDLHLRGSGELFGTKQTGYLQYKIARIDRDHKLIAIANSKAQEICEQNRDLAYSIARRWFPENFEAFSRG